MTRNSSTRTWRCAGATEGEITEAVGVGYLCGDTAALVIGVHAPEGPAANTQQDHPDDPRIERYWQLTTIISGKGPVPSPLPAFRWFASALRASQDATEAGSRLKFAA